MLKLMKWQRKSIIIRKELMNTMVILKEIKKENNIVSFNYHAEGDDLDCGRILFDIDKNKEKNIEYCKTDENSYLHSYANKAIDAIKKVIADGKYPTEYVYMWY